MGAMSKPVPPPSEVLDRMPPADGAAERCLLGSVLLLGADDAGKAGRAWCFVTAEQGDFHELPCQVLYDAAKRADAAGQPVADIVVLGAWMKTDGAWAKLQEVTCQRAVEFIAECVQAVGSPLNFQHYWKILRRMRARRALARLGEYLLTLAHDDTCNPVEQGEKAAARIKLYQSKVACLKEAANGKNRK